MDKATPEANELGLYQVNGIVFRSRGDGLDEDQDEMELLEIINQLLVKNKDTSAASGDKDTEINRLQKVFAKCIDELESSGYWHDHPSLVRYRAALPTPEPADA